jgi:hypothetical protein
MTSLTPSGHVIKGEGIDAFAIPFVSISDGHEYPVFGAFLGIDDLCMARWSDRSDLGPGAVATIAEPRKSTFSLYFSMLEHSQMISRFE